MSYSFIYFCFLANICYAVLAISLPIDVLSVIPEKEKKTSRNQNNSITDSLLVDAHQHLIYVLQIVQQRCSEVHDSYVL